MLSQSLYNNNYSQVYFLVTTLDPTHARALSNVAYFEDMIRTEPDKYVNADDWRSEEGDEEETEEARENMSNFERYQSLCRGPWPLVSLHHTLISSYLIHSNYCITLVTMPLIRHRIRKVLHHASML